MIAADELSDRVAFIDSGRIHALDTPDNLKLEHGRRAVKVRLRDRDEVGSTFLGVVRRYAERLQGRNSRLSLAGVSDDVLVQLERTGIIDSVGRENGFLATPEYGESLRQAMEAGERWIEEEPAP